MKDIWAIPCIMVAIIGGAGMFGYLSDNHAHKSTGSTNYGIINRYVDPEYGVACYYTYSGSQALSCVKVGPVEVR